VAYPWLLSHVASAYTRILEGMHFDHMAALPYAALPIATAISLQTGRSMLYPRKETKAYGTRAQIEGVFDPGQVAVVIDDLISTGGSKFEGIQKLTAAGLVVQDVVVLIDRSPDGAQELSRQGYKLHAVLTLHQLLDIYQASGKVPAERIEATRAYLAQARRQ
jgi:uridine monophosphate synthetase